MAWPQLTSWIAKWKCVKLWATLCGAKCRLMGLSPRGSNLIKLRYSLWMCIFTSILMTLSSWHSMQKPSWRSQEIKVLAGDMPLGSYGHLSNSLNLPGHDFLIRAMRTSFRACKQATWWLNMASRKVWDWHFFQGSGHFYSRRPIKSVKHVKINPTPHSKWNVI